MGMTCMDFIQMRKTHHGFVHMGVAYHDLKSHCMVACSMKECFVGKVMLCYYLF